MFITFEGLDSSGKSTQINLLENILVQNSKKVLSLREPGGTMVSEKIREILLDKTNNNLSARSEFLLFASSRAQLINEKIQPSLEKGIIVLCDRFADSSYAYQGFGRGLDLNFINEINQFATCNLVPDLTFFIDIPIDEIKKRREIDKKENDRMEIVGYDFFVKVRDGYLKLAEENKNRFKIINGLDSVDEIHNNIWEIVSKNL